MVGLQDVCCPLRQSPCPTVGNPILVMIANTVRIQQSATIEMLGKNSFRLRNWEAIVGQGREKPFVLG